MSIKWIVTDLDGTLLNSNQQIPNDLVLRINDFRKSGGRFTLATGRTLDGAMPIIRKLNIKEPVILFNGAKIYDPVSDYFIQEFVLPRSVANLFLSLYQSIGKSLGLDLLVFYKDKVYCSHKTEFIQNWLIKDKVEAIYKDFEWFYEIENSITKIMFLGHEEQLSLFQEHSYELDTVQSDHNIIEVLPPGVNKGAALRYLAEFVGGSLDEFAAVGDNLNDFEMVTMLRNGFAVQNANERLRESAPFITKRTNDESAIIEVIDHIGSHLLFQNLKKA